MADPRSARSLLFAFSLPAIMRAPENLVQGIYAKRNSLGLQGSKFPSSCSPGLANAPDRSL